MTDTERQFQADEIRNLKRSLAEEKVALNYWRGEAWKARDEVLKQAKRGNDLAHKLNVLQRNFDTLAADVQTGAFHPGEEIEALKSRIKDLEFEVAWRKKDIAAAYAKLRDTHNKAAEIKAIIER